MSGRRAPGVPSAAARPAGDPPAGDPQPLAPRPLTRAVTLAPGGGPAGDAVAAVLRSLGLEVLGGPAARAAGPAPAHCAVRIGNRWFGARPSAPQARPLDRPALRAAARRLCEAGGGRMVLLTDACGPALGGDPETAASHAADLHWWNELAARVAGRGVAVNTVRVGYAPFLGHRLSPEQEADLLRCQAVRRPVEPADLAGALGLLLSERAGNIVGETVPLDGGLDRAVVPFGGTGRTRPRSAPGRAAGSPWSLHGRRVLVTGASSGIGAACALRLAAAGAQTVLAARRTGPLETLAARIRDGSGPPAHVVPADLAEPGAGPALVARAEERAGAVDGLVHAAGVLELDRPGSPPAWQRMYRINLFSLVELADELAGRWTRRRVPGVIVPIGSVSAQITPVPQVQNYGAGKAAVAWYSSHLATTLARHRIRINTVLPAGVRTPMEEAADPAFVEASMRRVPSGRFSTPEEVAELVAYLAAPVSDGLTGAQLRICGGVGTLRPLPELLPGSGPDDETWRLP
ncbi:SDR family oxidoreductase [Streptomyces sp. YIM 98790]|uniref:SDR family oxidoreductase n=1 Tax=Streptomyces sp. YIM 98790 TaxID=2689077 RepID=UPI001407603C|nr:SDR family oxidoreductase [Streptomyces sp. YIM 98790]